MTRRTNRARAFAPQSEVPGRPCDIPNCICEGEYRAPKSRTNLRDYHWFCLEHVRAYNASWDYYKGMSPAQIEANMRADSNWQRPTWPMGRLGGGWVEEDALHDRLDVLGAGGVNRKRAAPDRPAVPPELRQPLDALGLRWPVSLDELKSRYKALAKRHHPDANGGDRGAEERLKLINLAYATVKTHLSGAAAPA